MEADVLNYCVDDLAAGNYSSLTLLKDLTHVAIKYSTGHYNAIFGALDNSPPPLSLPLPPRGRPFGECIEAAGCRVRVSTSDG